ncbi:MAG TPA: DUF664 domain-containing protein [Chryseolinea sp.]
MPTLDKLTGRRNFIRNSAAITAGLIGVTGSGCPAHTGNFYTADPSVFVIGPMDGYSIQIGTLVSMLNYNRYTIINMVKSMSMKELDHLHDANANTIGSLVLHLGATEKFYQINTFEGRQDFNEEEKKTWGAAMSLGEEGRQNIKGKEAQYYIDAITAVREKTLAEFKKKDDNWLLAIDPEWSKERPLNTYWKWFHVCEHEANHRGQIAFLKSRLPGAKPSRE